MGTVDAILFMFGSALSGLGTAAVNLVVFWTPFAIIGMVALSIGKIWEKIKS